MYASCPPKFHPVELKLADHDPDGTRRWQLMTWAFVALGVAIRLNRYLLKFPLWGDELMLAENFLDRGYSDLMQPLNNIQCAPLLFLWIELAAIKLIGFSEWSLRLFPAVCSIGGVFLFRHLASRIVQGLPLLIAVAIFAVSHLPIRYGAEVKPYASDLTVSLVLLVLAVEWLRRPQQSRWLWALALLAPIAIGLSFPAVFVAGGICLGIAWPAWRAGWRARFALAACNLATLGSFLLFAWLSLQGQFRSSGDYMQRYWADGFPPVTQPLKLAAWLLLTHTGELLAYPIGGERCGSILTAICCGVGVWILARKRQHTLLCMFAGIALLALIAAALRRYPYGDNSRLVQYLAPPICLLAGLGAAGLITALGSARSQRRAALVLTVLLGLGGTAIVGFDLVHPYKYRADYVHRGFAQWFWSNQPPGADVISLRPEDFQRFSTNWDRCAYRCMQRIYAPQPGDAPNGPAPGGRPFRFVLYRSTDAKADEQALAAWLEDMRARYELVEQRRFTVNLSIPRRKVIFGDYAVYEFAPRGGTSVARTPAEAGRLQR